ncbi:MAG: hypothetical protein VKK04_05440 [Synechococcales bacterium]|nr:hypothetical protein [Synechococcales bacterium]
MTRLKRSVEFILTALALTLAIQFLTPIHQASINFQGWQNKIAPQPTEATEKAEP